MKTKSILMILALFAVTICAEARDLRTDAVLRSAMVVAILENLVVEQGLSCQLAIEENGSESVAYFVENGRSRFSAGFLCDDGRTAIVDGIAGDGGQIVTEAFRLVFAN